MVKEEKERAHKQGEEHLCKEAENQRLWRKCKDKKDAEQVEIKKDQEAATQKEHWQAK